jgi:hypothetical protein
MSEEMQGAMAVLLITGIAFIGMVTYAVTKFQGV